MKLEKFKPEDIPLDKQWKCGCCDTIWHVSQLHVEFDGRFVCPDYFCGANCFPATVEAKAVIDRAMKRK